ncbi:hypothetical protein [Asanoa iriomotensis]|uniref:Uncharacterized protein n=1 Tax=Asanoa iriomotensis TaxID=234613 RepID=A0ABQ4C3V9_9ACTN|nr:hypothetical protein [Asanoa iriomotensis]GIF57450.1 hypothetical protein Air01nite_35450 [Asanoa iriomotensis]
MTAVGKRSTALVVDVGLSALIVEARVQCGRQLVVVDIQDGSLNVYAGPRGWPIRATLSARSAT